MVYKWFVFAGSAVRFKSIRYYATKMQFYFCSHSPGGASSDSVTREEKGGGGGGWCCLLRKSEIAGSNHILALIFKKKHFFFPGSLVKIQYCGEP